ncbi:MAG TPA: thymidine phosphorylase [Oculatellaceae cyanobacterium]
MRMVDLITAKRQGREHTRKEIEFIVHGVMDGSIPDYQLSAWLMAVCWRGMTIDETAFLTDAMSKSGEVLDLSEIGPLVGDKHSTGGVGDKTTLVFVPMMAAAGVPMAKLSGRGLGHTGGTIDKLEAIPNFNTAVGTKEFISQIKEIGMAIGGQTQELAPADGRMYAMRDVTGTVESIPLIAASVMSKKIAAGANLIILDVKCGKGAFMETQADAERLAQMMADVGKRLGKPVIAVVTDMDQPLGCAVGHTLEVIEAVETLKGDGPDDFRDLCLSLGSLALVAAKKSPSEAEARKHLEKLLCSGKALDYFRKLIKAQGGDPAVVDDYSLMPTAKHEFDFVVPGKGTKYISHIDGRKVAEACKIMGAGRAKKGDPIDLAVGVVLSGKVGSKVEGGQPIVRVHANSEKHFDAVKEKLAEAFTFTETPVPSQGIVKACVA